MNKICLPLVGAVAASASTAQAAIVYSGVVNQSVSGVDSSLAFDPLTGGVGSGPYSLDISADPIMVNLNGGGSADESIFTVYKGDTGVIRMNSGTAIGAELTEETWGMLNALSVDGSAWRDGQAGYAALRVQPTSSSSYHYGWAQVELHDTFDGATLIDFAYEDTPDTSIVAGAVPEPAHAAALLALGAVGVAAYRHRQRS